MTSELPSREECIRNCRLAYADGWADLWDQVRLHGVQAAAERVFYPGHPLGSAEAIAGRIESLRAGDRRTRGRNPTRPGGSTGE